MQPLDVVVTASSQRKRKVGFGEDSVSSPASPAQSGLDSPSPTNSDSTRATTPRFIPPHLHDEVLVSRESDGASSPSRAFAEVTIDGSDMSGSEGEQRKLGSPTRTFGVRSASPAKRSATEMEGSGKDAPSVPGSFAQVNGDGRTDFDEAMAGMTPSQSGDVETQETVTDTTQTSASGSATTDTAATSFQSENLRPESANGTQKSSSTYNAPSIDEQVRVVSELAQGTLDEGQMGYVVSNKWLARVRSRTSEGLQSHTKSFEKAAREGPIGPVDNSDLVPEHTFDSPLAQDVAKKFFIPLNPGLVPGEDYELLPEKAWGQIIAWYGMSPGQKQIVRYAHDTAPSGAPMPNVMYELYPPVFTIRKVPQENSEKATSKSSVDLLRLKKTREARGQMSEDDAFRLVSSRSEKFQQFLKRAKEAAEIPFATKVKVWKLSKPSGSASESHANGVPSPPQSRSTSPNVARPEKLVISSTDFHNMEDCEPVNTNDETANSNYNGGSTIDTYNLGHEDATLVLEEQMGGPGGGEFASVNKPKNTIKIGLASKAIGSKPGSIAPSRAASPAPKGAMTRGRQRRDGRTRGTVGLSNLGNTCYMNSALQCIRSVEELAVYFLSDKFKAEINTSNPLGHGGVMAKQYSVVLQSIYGETAGGSYTPSSFKTTLGRLQPLFSGYGQQDSQEFLSFLVDALHEDLNRIIKKPYNENPDSDDKTVHDPQAIIKLGETYRANHKARNDSIAMDLFSGFYKNTMECPDCNKISITFDPFSLVTVQLPIESIFSHTFTYVPLHGRPVNHAIDIDKNSTVKTVLQYIASKHPGTNACKLWLAEVYSQKIFKVFEQSITLAEAAIGDNDYIFVFELAQKPSNPPTANKQFYSSYSFNRKRDVPEMDDPMADQFALPVFSRQKNRFGNGWDMCLHPMYITVSREEAKDYDVVLKKVLYAISRLTSLPMLTDMDDVSEDEAATPESKPESEETAGDDKVEVSDKSASDDGYVKISKHSEATQPASNEVAEPEDDRPMPAGFMNPEYILPAALRSRLFTMKVVKSADLHCTGLNSVEDKNVITMADRVKLPERSGSVASSTSGDDESTTSTASGGQENGELDAEASDMDMDRPDITIGETPKEDSLSMPTPIEEAEASDEELPDNPLEGMQKPGGRRGKKQQNGKKNPRRKQKTYSRKERRQKQQQFQQNQAKNNNVRFNVGGKSLVKDEDDDENPYYIKLGEGIIVDWFPEALQHFFEGRKDDESDDRGHWVSTSDGRGLPTFDDPVVQERKTTRALRKKQGITLDDCFAETGKREVLSEDNAWYCGNCKELRRATKTLEIWTMPDILVVHLKRFGGNRSFRDKIDVLVDYPKEGLDMTERIGLKEDGKEYLYDLFAVDNHYGGLGGGHYTAFAKNFYDGAWYDYNGKIPILKHQA